MDMSMDYYALSSENSQDYVMGEAIEYYGNIEGKIELAVDLSFLETLDNIITLEDKAVREAALAVIKIAHATSILNLVEEMIEVISKNK